MDTFKTSYSVTSLILSVQMGATLCVGPLAASLVKKFGCCKITVLGSIVAATGLVSSGFAPNIGVLFFSAGFCTGYCRAIDHCLLFAGRTSFEMYVMWYL